VFKEEKYEINSTSIGITEADGDGTNFKDIWDLRVPLNTFILLKSGDYVALYLIGDDGYEMPKSTRVRVVRRDVANEDSKPVLPEVLYQLVKDFIDRNKLMKLPIGAIIGPEEHIVVQVAGKDCLGLYPIHIADDTVNVVTTANAVDTLEQCRVLANEIKADYNAHRVATAYHLVADATNVVDAADVAAAGTQAELNTLVNQIKAKFNPHRTQSGVHPYNDNLNIVTAADATDLASSITLANEEKADYNAHRTCGEEGVGDVDASESYFKIVTTRRRKTL